MLDFSKNAFREFFSGSSVHESNGYAAMRKWGEDSQWPIHDIALAVVGLAVAELVKDGNAGT